MTQTTARVKKEGKHFEILVDEEEAIKLKKGEGDISRALLTGSVFYNLKSGEHASNEDLEKNFQTTDLNLIAQKIIKNGEIVRTTSSLNDEQEKKYKQIVEFLVKNATSLQGLPYTPDRIMKSLKEAHINVKNKSISEQIPEIIDQLSEILPIKIDVKRIKIRIPALHTGKSYGTVKEFTKEENWQSNGDLECIVEVPSGLLMNFFDKINNQTHGSVMSEELKN